MNKVTKFITVNFSNTKFLKTTGVILRLPVSSFQTVVLVVWVPLLSAGHPPRGAGLGDVYV